MAWVVACFEIHRFTKIRSPTCSHSRRYRTDLSRGQAAGPRDDRWFGGREEALTTLSALLDLEDIERDPSSEVAPTAYP